MPSGFKIAFSSWIVEKTLFQCLLSYFEKLEKKYEQPRLLSFEAENNKFFINWRSQHRKL